MAASESASNDSTPPAALSADKAAAAASVITTATTKVIAVLALLIALLALALAGWSGSQQLALKDLPGRVGADAGKLDSVQQRLDRLADSLARQQQSVADLEESVTTSLSSITDLPLRLEQVEKQVADIPGINPQSRSNWLKTEALYYMRIANAQAALAGNADVAASALRLADDKLRDSGDPALVAVREQLSNEIAALEAVPAVDRVGIAFRLKALATQAGEWPFRQLAPDSFAPALAAPPNQLGPLDRLMETLRSVLASIVTVKATDELAPAQLGSSEQSLIVESVKAELQVARLAFVSGNAELFLQSLKYAEQLVKTYFDLNAVPVAAALQTLAELRGLERPAALPDISGSLALMLTKAGSSEAR